MNEVNQVTIIFTQIKHNSDQIKSFRSIIERISGEEYDKVEIVKTESLI
ncbi:MAG: hypothetical protein E7B21_03110 [Staphylococcus epidermidis]|nr:hypothetical protein [Staphylococcus epidermidis]